MSPPFYYFFLLLLQLLFPGFYELGCRAPALGEGEEAFV